MDINNPGGELMSYEVWWLPRGRDNSEPMSSGRFTLGAGSSARYSNILDEVIHLDPDDRPFGSVAIASDREHFISTARTYNQPGEGDGGTVGQWMPGVDSDELLVAGERQRIILLTENESFRTNIGC